jgi:hypothetical protein
MKRNRSGLTVGIAAAAATMVLVCATGASASTSVASAGAACSKATAIQLAVRLHLGNAGFVTDPVGQVLCGAFAGPGNDVMVFTLTAPTAPGVLGWVVFRFVGGAWDRLEPLDGGGVEVAAVGSDIRATESVFRPGDAMCCPSGGTKTQIWHWNGTRLVASAWTLRPPRPTPSAGRVTGPIYAVAPVQNGPDFFDGIAVKPTIMGMQLDDTWVIGHLVWSGWGTAVAHGTGSSVTMSCDVTKNPVKCVVGTSHPAQVTLTQPELVAGHQIYACFQLSVPSSPSSNVALECVIGQNGGGAYVPVMHRQSPTTVTNSTGITPVGGATSTSAQFFSPDRRVSCNMEDPPTRGYYVYCNASGLHAAWLGPDGHAVICNSGCLGMNGPTTPTLGYGKQITVGRFRCSSASAGITCVVIRSGKGFLINSAGVTRVGP